VLIDWFTVGAQAINFLILVWLLKRYLYTPVLAAIDAREKKVAATIDDARTQEAKARAAGDEFRKRNADFDHEREGLMRKAAEEAGAEHQRLVEAARQDSQLLRVKLTQSLAADRAQLGRQLTLGTQSEVFALTRKALSELADTSLEDRVIEVLISRLRELPGNLAVPAVPDRVVLIRSAYDPSPAARARLEAAVRERFDRQIPVRFEAAPDLILGLELSTDGVKLAWSVSDYLSTLARDAAALTSAALVEPALVH
jgi:F-type H+-transporting ATPase subunit b